MRKILFILAAISLPFVLFGCQQVDDNPEVPTVDRSNSQAESRDGDFIYRLVTEKERYHTGEPVKLYAELEYVGLKDEVVIEHGSSPFYFPMKETTRNYEIGYQVTHAAEQTVLKRGVALRQETTGGGGYSEHDEEGYKEFMKQVMERKYPSGHYNVNGLADFTVVDEQKKYRMETQIEFYVDE